MARSDAQREADKRYREKHKGEELSWGTKFKPAEIAEIDAVIKQSGMSRAEFVRWAVKEYQSTHGEMH